MTFDHINVILFFAATALTVPIGIPFLYVVIKKSPASFRSYRNNLLNLSCWYYCSAVSIGLLLQPVMAVHDSMTCARLYGLSIYLGKFMSHVALYFGVIVTLNCASALWLSFFDRYIQLAHQHFAEWFATGKGTVCCVLWHALGVLVGGAMVYACVSHGKTVVLADSIMICVDLNGDFLPLAVICGVAVVVAVISMSMCLLMYLCIRALRSRRHMMSAKTYRLQMLLTVNLVILTALPVVFDMIPIGFACVTLSLNLQNSNLPYTAVSIAMHLPFLDIIFSFCVTLCFVGPYRKAVLELFCKPKKKITSVSVVTRIVE